MTAWVGENIHQARRIPMYRNKCLHRQGRGSLLVLRSFPTFKRRDSDEYFLSGGSKFKQLPFYARKQIFSFEFFAPFQFLFFEEKEKLKCLKNQRLLQLHIQKHALQSPKDAVGSSFALSDGLMKRLYDMLYNFFRIQ